MKKYTLTILVFTMLVLVFQNVYATDELIVDEVEKEITTNGSPNEAKNEVFETGNVTIKFIQSFSDGEVEYPLSDVKIEIYNNPDPTSMTSMFVKQLNGKELVSNKEGEIKIEDLPYGQYKYVVKSLPSGFVAVKTEGYFEITPFDYEVYIEAPVNIAIKRVDGVAKLNDPIDPKTGRPPADELPVIKPPVATEGVNPVQPTTQNVSLDKQDTATGGVNPETKVTTETTTTSTQEVEYTPTQEQVKVLGNMYESAKNDFKVKEDTEEVDIENIPLSATVPVKVELNKKDAIKAMKETRITEQIRIATLDMDSTLLNLQKMSTVTDHKKE